MLSGKDIFGNSVSPGDEVAFNPVGYKGLVLGVVTKITPKGFRVQQSGRQDDHYVPTVAKRIKQ